MTLCSWTIKNSQNAVPEIWWLLFLWNPKQLHFFKLSIALVDPLSSDKFFHVSLVPEYNFISYHTKALFWYQTFPLQEQLFLCFCWFLCKNITGTLSQCVWQLLSVKFLIWWILRLISCALQKSTLDQMNQGVTPETYGTAFINEI